MTARHRVGVLLVAILVAPFSLLQARPPVRLGDAPTAPDPGAAGRLGRDGPIVLGPGGSFSVNVGSREEVRNFFNTVYAASADFSTGWTGNIAGCSPGGTDASFRDLVVLRINFFRAMAGIPAGIVLNDVNNTKDQAAALIMSANNQLSHFPPTTWTCYSDTGYEAAHNSNIALGNTGPDAIDAYINDFGSNNSIAGHRRWLLYPQTQTMGTGDVPETGPNNSANATWVFDSNFGGPRPATRDGFVSWPPPGYVPYQVVYARWSIGYPNADFSAATVTVSSNGVSVPVTLEALATGYGENTLVWHPSALDPSGPVNWPRPAADTVYNVSVQNVKGSGVPSSFSYTVRVFDPQVPGPDTVLPAVTGPDQPAVNQTNAYSFTAVANASGYQWRQTQRAAFTAVEGAENGLTYFTTNTAPDYSVLVTSPKASGSYAFHLAHTVPDDEILTYTRVLLPGANSQVQFQSRLGWATATQIARVQVSLDQGGSWQDIYSQAGSGGSGEGSFTARTAPLSGLAGRSILIRFNYHYDGDTYYFQSDPGVGWYIDNISFSNTEELTGPVITSVSSGTAFGYVPGQAGDYGLDVRAQVYGRYYLEWGPVKRVTASAAAPAAVQLNGTPTVSAGQVQIDFDVANYRPGMTFQLFQSADLSAGWTQDGAAAFQTLVANSKFRVTTSTAGAPRTFYRVQAN